METWLPSNTIRVTVLIWGCGVHELLRVPSFFYGRPGWFGTITVLRFLAFLLGSRATRAQKEKGNVGRIVSLSCENSSTKKKSQILTDVWTPNIVQSKAVRQIKGLCWLRQNASVMFSLQLKEVEVWQFLNSCKADPEIQRFHPTVRIGYALLVHRGTINTDCEQAHFNNC